MYEVDEPGGGGMLRWVELLDHQVLLYGVESGAEVNEDDSGKVSLVNQGAGALVWLSCASLLFSFGNNQASDQGTAADAQTSRRLRLQKYNTHSQVSFIAGF